MSARRQAARAIREADRVPPPGLGRAVDRARVLVPGLQPRRSRPLRRAAAPPIKHVYVATGLNKWGITAGTAAAGVISDAILGHENDWSGLFSTCIRPLQEAPRFVLENARAGFRFFAERLKQRGTRPIADLGRRGAIVSAAGEKVAGFRDADGMLHAVSSRCTHLGCQMVWNAAERTWDCPCHGSRFDVDGSVLNRAGGEAARTSQSR